MAGVGVACDLERSFELQIALSEIETAEERKQLIKEYLVEAEEQSPTVVPDFDNGWEWFNTGNPLSLQKELSGKVVILDFFTYCCINCMHILPDLHTLEQTYKDTDGAVVVGVHSAKFENEKVSANILSAIVRYGISHAVVNDAEAKLWHQLQIQCWPTLVFVGPHNQILFMLMGEGHRQLLLEFVTVALEHFKGQGLLKFHPVPLRLSKDSLPPSPLLFPGKVNPDEHGDRLAVADTGHHRILILSNKGVLQFAIGGSSAGFEDGSFDTAKFCSPQGVVWSGNKLYVADTENHAIREIDLDKKKVVTLAGTGQQGRDKEGGKTGVEQALSSPWDVCLGSSVDSCRKDVLFIAMAGSHQIWMIFLEDGKWLKNKEYKQGTCVRFAGNGAEENRNNNYPHNAAFAQPSGIALGCMDESPGDFLFIADSESSSVRSVSLTDGAVKNVCGATKDPKNLFAFGDADGKGIEAKLQHPLGVTLQKTKRGPLLVADSYNHKIKSIDLKTKECRTLFGTGQPGSSHGLDLSSWQLNEPGGLAMHPNGKLLYIADTNNHSIQVYDFDDNNLYQLPVIIPDDDLEVDGFDVEMDEVDGPADVVDSSNEIQKPVKRITRPSAKVIDLGLRVLPPGEKITMKLKLELDKGQHLTEGAPSAWQIFQEGTSPYYILGKVPETKGKLENIEEQPAFELHVPSENGLEASIDVMVECVVYHCNDEGLCKMTGLVFKQPLKITSDIIDSDVNHFCELQYRIS